MLNKVISINNKMCPNVFMSSGIAGGRGLLQLAVPSKKYSVKVCIVIQLYNYPSS
jgi:hypothetical protein